MGTVNGTSRRSLMAILSASGILAACGGDAAPAAAPAAQPTKAPAAAGAGSAATPPTLAPVRWELSATMARLQPAEQLAVLQRLGADGLARRLQTLASLGLLP